MALIPFAEKKLIKPDARDPRIAARIGILHVDAGNASDLYNLFLGNQRDGGTKIEAHGHVRRDGHLYQYRDTDFEADANYEANSFALSFETQGYGDGEWTADQLATIKRLMLWARDEHHIPLRKVTSWDDKQGGWGYHTQFGAPGHWTPIAKSCPGAKRIKQFNEILVPWMAAQNKEVTVADTHVTRARTHLLTSLREARRSILELEAVSPRRTRVRAQIIKLKAARAALKSVYSNLPTS